MSLDPGAAERLLELSRRARWPFPTSSGPPLRPDEREPWAEELLASRASLAEAAAVLEPDDAVELGANAWRIWMVARELGEGRAFLAAALDGDGGTLRHRALALYGDGLLAFWTGAYDESRDRNEQALELARESGDAEALTLAHVGLCRSFFGAGDYERAQAAATEELTHAERLEPAMSQAPLHGYGQSARFRGDLDLAADVLGQSLALNRRVDDQGMIVAELHNLGHVELHRGNVDVARRLFEEVEARSQADDPYSLAMSHLNAGALAFVDGDHERATQELASADATLRDSGVEPAPDDQFELDNLREQLVE